jgi:hypothetical protein
MPIGSGEPVDDTANTPPRAAPLGSVLARSNVDTVPVARYTAPTFQADGPGGLGDGPAGPDGGLGVPESSELPPPPPQATKNAENAIVSARLRLVWRPSPSDAGPSVRESVTQSLHLMFALVFGRVAGQKRISSAAE